MNIDFHFHTLLSKKATFSLDYFKKTIHHAKKSGLTAIVMTEHFNAKHFDDIFKTLDATYAYKGHYYDVDGFKVFTGMEVDIKEKGHILVSGHKNDITTIRQQLLLDFGDKFASLDELLARLEKFNVLVIGAHPYRKGRELTKIRPSLLKKLDALDLNGKDIKLRDDVEKFAQLLELPLVAGSDTHHYYQAGTVKNLFPNSCETSQDLKRHLQEEKVEIEIDRLILYKNLKAKWKKRIFKKIR
ncbi:MAG: PHP domain-containing protein [Turicibacter sp.]